MARRRADDQAPDRQRHGHARQATTSSSRRSSASCSRCSAGASTRSSSESSTGSFPRRMPSRLMGRRLTDPAPAVRRSCNQPCARITGRYSQSSPRFALGGCGSAAKLQVENGTGPDPTLPPPEKSLIPTVKIAPAVGWPDGGMPGRGGRHAGRRLCGQARSPALALRAAERRCPRRGDRRARAPGGRQGHQGLLHEEGDEARGLRGSERQSHHAAARHAMATAARTCARRSSRTSIRRSASTSSATRSTSRTPMR